MFTGSPFYLHVKVVFLLHKTFGRILHLGVLTVFVLAISMTAVLTGCSGDDVSSTPPEVQGPVELPEGDRFLKSGFKIKSEVKMKSSVSTDPLIFEVYVDSDGDGNGLVGYRDNVYDLYLVAEEVYVVVSSELTVHLTDITSHMVPKDLLLTGTKDLSTVGFTTLDGEVVSFTGATSEVDMVTRFEKSTSSFEPVSILQSNNMTSGDLLRYFFQNATTTYVEDTPKPEDELVRQSFYVNSDWAVTIRDKAYSLGDFCAPYTYFDSMVPQGINSQDEWREDKKVEINYVSYISSDGLTSFMTTDGYVQAISTTSAFTFLGEIKSGMSVADLEAILGIGLRKDDLANFQPLREGMTAYKNSKTYTIKYLDITVELVADKQTGLSQITITNYLDFRS